MQALPCLMKLNPKTSLIQMRWACTGEHLLVAHQRLELLCKAREGQSRAARSCRRVAVRSQSLFPLEKVGVNVALGNGTAVWGSEAGVGTHILWRCPFKFTNTLQSADDFIDESTQLNNDLRGDGDGLKRKGKVLFPSWVNTWSSSHHLVPGR